MPACSTPFQKKHKIEYALSITTRDIKDNVDTVQCQFCVHLGRETSKEECRMRKWTENVMV